MRRFGGLVLCTFCLMASGCAIAQVGRDIVDATVETFRPNTHDYVDPVDDTDWSVAGREGRGERLNDHEEDGLTKIIDSPKAQSINRNLRVY